MSIPAVPVTLLAHHNETIEFAVGIPVLHTKPNQALFHRHKIQY